jgi:predicted PurR-regulated permease PerM
MARTGSRLLGSRSSSPAPDEGTQAPDPATGGDGSVPPAGGRRRRALNAMSPFRIGFVGTLGVLLAYGLARALIAAQSVVILVVVALFIALGLDPLVRRLTRVGLKRGLAILVVLLGVLIVLALVLYATIPVFIEQVGNLVDAAPAILQETLRNPQVNALNERYQVISKAQEFVSSGSLLQGAFGGLLGAASAVLGAVFSGFTVLILALYFLVSLPQLRNAVVHLSPASRRARASYLTDQIFLRISAYISGTFVVALIAGVLSYIFLLIVGLGEFALALAVLVAVLDIIPLIGATLGAIVVVIIGFTQSPTVGIACLIFYAVYQQFENYVVQPRVFKRAVDVPGVLVVIAALVGGALLGITGALLAVPVAAVALLILREVAQPRLDAG